MKGGEIVVVESVTSCSVLQQALNAVNSSASAVLVYNRATSTSLLGVRVRGAGWFPGDPLVQIPVLSISYSVGATLVSLLNNNTNPVTVSLQTNSTIFITQTFNVFCETKEGDVNNTIIVGAHLDSVETGPGINDNGSGSSVILEIFLSLYRFSIPIRNKLIFAWWGSEEEGLLGSRHYVNDLFYNNRSQFNNTVLNLNFDMLASPNFIPMVVDTSSLPSSPFKTGSENLKVLLQQIITKNGYNYSLAGPSGTDFLPFLENQIPANGLQAGAGSMKTMQDRESFGGLADAALDTCYHRRCDTVKNVDLPCLTLLSQTAAFAIQCLSNMKDLKSFLFKPNLTSPIDYC